jgi:hypothetical protein
MKQYYLISLKHTSKGDTALTFWCANGNGYTWHKNRAGIYNEDEIDKYIGYDTVAVLKEVVDPFWMNALDFRDEFISVPNNPTTRLHLGITDKAMKPKKFAGCRMSFINTPITQ